MTRSLAYRSFRRGFSFTEVLFAVVILGIGFIMVAAIFPVAIQQSKLTMDETTGASLARGAANYVTGVVSDLDRTTNPPTSSDTATNCKVGQEALSLRAVVQQLSYTVPAAGNNPSLVTALRGNQILPEDPRYAFAVLYRRAGIGVADPRAASVQIHIFALQATVKSTFEPSLDAFSPSGLTTAAPAASSAPENNLMAHSIRVAIRHNVAELGNIDIIAIDSASGDALQQFNAGFGSNPNVGVGAAVEGGYVIIAKDHLTSGVAPNLDQGRMDGSVYRLGVRRTDLDVATYFSPSPMYGKFSTLGAQSPIFELDPSTPFVPDAGADGIRHNYGADITAKDDVVALGNLDKMYVDEPQAANNLNNMHVTMTPLADGTAEAYVVGRSFIDPLNPRLGFEGGNMAVGYYTTFGKVN